MSKHRNLSFGNNFLIHEIEEWHFKCFILANKSKPMQEVLTVELPDGRGLEMPRYLAKKFYDFLKQVQNSEKEINVSDYASKWLQNLIREDQAKVKKIIEYKV